MFEDQQTIRRPHFKDDALFEGQEIYVQNDAPIFSDQEASQPSVVLKMASSRVVDVEQAGNFLPDKAADFFANLFPHLFRYGERHPDVIRSIRVSLE